MPIVTVDSVTRPEHGVEVVASILENSTLPLESVIKYDEAFAQGYPSVQVMSGGYEKEIHGLHTWLYTVRVDIYVMHAQLSDDRQTRNLNDLKLATDIVALLEGPIDGGDPLKLGRYFDTDLNDYRDRVIAGWVERENPGRMPPSGITKGKSVVSTLLNYVCTNEGRF